jgi:hypothetical protein
MVIGLIFTPSDLRADPSSIFGCAASLVTRLSGRLAIWAGRLEFSPYRLRVMRTSGSGKTQPALAEYAAAIDTGLRPLYVCFNRPLADHHRALAPFTKIDFEIDELVFRKLFVGDDAGG